MVSEGGVDNRHLIDQEVLSTTGKITSVNDSPIAGKVIRDSTIGNNRKGANPTGSRENPNPNERRQ